MAVHEQRAGLGELLLLSLHSLPRFPCLHANLLAEALCILHKVEALTFIPLKFLLIFITMDNWNNRHLLHSLDLQMSSGKM